MDTIGVYRASDVAARNFSLGRRNREALIYTGATKSVVGLRTAHSISRADGHCLQLMPSNRRFRLSVKTQAIGSCRILMLTSGVFVQVQADI